jgi:hypothetical protein
MKSIHFFLSAKVAFNTQLSQTRTVLGPLSSRTRCEEQVLQNISPQFLKKGDFQWHKHNTCSDAICVKVVLIWFFTFLTVTENFVLHFEHSVTVSSGTHSTPESLRFTLEGWLPIF